MEVPSSPSLAARGAARRSFAMNHELPQYSGTPRAQSPAVSESSTSSASHNDAENPSAVAPLICEECEDRGATLECEDCGLVYCVACDKSRHRKGKLVFHQRKRVELTQRPIDPSLWTLDHVKDWLCGHELDVFLADADAHSIDGAFLMSPQIESFLEAQSSASRGHKKKLLREIQKLKTDCGSAATSTHTSPDRISIREAATSSAFSSPRSPAFPQNNSVRRMGVNLRVNIDAQPAPAPEKHFSPVAALRARVTHGQVDDLKGRVHRRTSSKLYSDLVLAASPSNNNNNSDASTPIVNVNKSVERRHTPMVVPPLEIEMSARRNPGLPPLEMAAAVDPPSRDLRAIRQALGGLDLDMMNVKKDERAVEASFDFSAEGRLQTQGFEINQNGIANAPFPNQEATSKRKPSQRGTRESLVMLNELGQGAGGKVYKALHVPTFKLVAVKVIRVFDQKKRHQMVRELKSLYANWVPIDEPSAHAACDELVIFYDAYTNPELGSVSIVLEYMDGGSLEDYMQSGTTIAERELASIAYYALKGLAFLHEHHQLHRDIKLSNMLINSSGAVKISDFGISRDLESTLAKATTFTGTLLYMAPERISGGHYSYPSDVWSFGLALMACAIGKLPVPTKEGYWGVVHAVQEQPSPKLADYGDHFSPELCEFIDFCLRKNPMTRPRASQLLEHAFIKKNYEPGVRQSLETPRQASEKALQELDNIATKVEQWYSAHAASPSHADALRQLPHQDKVEALARQLRVPLDVVAAKFAFMA